MLFHLCIFLVQGFEVLLNGILVTVLKSGTTEKGMSFWLTVKYTPNEVSAF